MMNAVNEWLSKNDIEKFSKDFYKFHDIFLIEIMNKVIDDFNNVFNYYDNEEIEYWKSSINDVINLGEFANYIEFNTETKQEVLVKEVDFEYIINTLKYTLIKTRKNFGKTDIEDNELEYIRENINNYKEEISHYRKSLFSNILMSYLGLI